MSHVAAPRDEVQLMSTDQRLAWAVMNDSRQGSDLALNDGADVNGSVNGLPPPIVIAANHGHVGILKLLIDRGADLEAALLETKNRKCMHLLGVRAVHAAIKVGEVDALRLLLQAGADPNSLNLQGTTPLMLRSARDVPAATRLEMMDALLSAGADPLLGNKSQGGWKAIHYAALRGETLLVSKIYSSAPTTLNAVDKDGRSPLVLASYHGHKGTVSFLLSVGASDAERVKTQGYSALLVAVGQDREDVVRVLLDEGLEAAGGLIAIPNAIAYSVERDNVCILQILLNVGGEDMQEIWAGTWVQPVDHDGDFPAEPVLHIAARFCSYRAAHVLLSAGADELAANALSKRASDIIGVSVVGDISRRSTNKAAFGRVLKHGPAFRARSWLWPTQAGAKAAVEIGAGVTRSVPSSAQVPALGVWVIERKHRSFIHRALARYASCCSGWRFCG